MLYDEIRKNFPKDTKLAVSITGGGLCFFNELILAGGASEYFVFGKVPYSELMQPIVEKSVSADMVIAECHNLCREIQIFNWDKIALSASFSLKKVVGERRGRLNHGYIHTIYSNKKNIVERTYYVKFNKRYHRTRKTQENLAGLAIAQCIMQAIRPTSSRLLQYVNIQDITGQHHDAA